MQKYFEVIQVVVFGQVLRKRR